MVMFSVNILLMMLTFMLKVSLNASWTTKQAFVLSVNGLVTFVYASFDIYFITSYLCHPGPAELDGAWEEVMADESIDLSPVQHM